MPRLQVNLSFTAEAFEVVKTAAESQEVSVAAFCRAAIMDAAQPIPEDVEAVAGGFPAWLLALLALLRRTPKPKPRWELHFAAMAKAWQFSSSVRRLGLVKGFGSDVSLHPYGELARRRIHTSSLGLGLLFPGIRWP